MTFDDLERQDRGFMDFLPFSANGGSHAFDLVRNTKIHALDMALGVICHRV